LKPTLAEQGIDNNLADRAQGCKIILAPVEEKNLDLSIFLTLP
jgi:hypothetical protein